MHNKMNDTEVANATRSVLNVVARGGMRRSLFIDSVSDDADMIMQEVLTYLPQSRKHLVEGAIIAWRIEFAYMRDLPDRIKGDIK